MTRIFLALIAVGLLAINSGCAVNGGGTTPAINDQLVIADAAVVTEGIILTRPQAEQAPCAEAIYEAASAVNTAAKNGIDLADLQSLAASYTTGPYAGLISSVVQMIILNVDAISGSSLPTTQLNGFQLLNPAEQEMAEDVSAGAMEGALAETGGATPTPALTFAESRGHISVRHFLWRPKP